MLFGPPGHKRIGDYLLEVGALSHEQLEEALEVQRHGERLGRILVKLGHVSEVNSRSHRAPMGSSNKPCGYDLRRLIKLVPENLARRYKVITMRRMTTGDSRYGRPPECPGHR